MTQFIYISGAFLAFFLCLLVISKKKKRNYDYLLFTWLILISLHISVFYLAERGILTQSRWIMVNGAFPLMQGPFLFLYSGLLMGKIKVSRAQFLHFLPAILLALFLSRVTESWTGILIGSIILSGTIYIILTLRLLGGIKLFFQSNFNWLKILVSGIGLIWITFIGIGLMNHLNQNSFIDHEYIFLAINAFVFLIGFFGLKENFLLQEPAERGRYQSSSLTANDFDQIGQSLKNLAAQNKFFLDPELKLTDLAFQLSISPHHLSQYFSSALNTTYYDYINALRIEELKERIQEMELANLSLLGLALDCGFNSKATFNRAFKKHSGQTPSEYLKSIK